MTEPSATPTTPTTPATASPTATQKAADEKAKKDAEELKKK